MPGIPKVEVECVTRMFSSVIQMLHFSGIVVVTKDKAFDDTLVRAWQAVLVGEGIPLRNEGGVNDFYPSEQLIHYPSYSCQAPAMSFKSSGILRAASSGRVSSMSS